MQHTIDVVEYLDLTRPRIAGGGSEIRVRLGLVGGVNPGSLANGSVELEIEVKGAVPRGEGVGLI
jgi:hypothetical protein